MAEQTDAEQADLLRDIFGDLEQRSRELERSAERFARTITVAFTRGVAEGRQFDDVLKSLALRLSDLALRAAFQPLEGAVSGGVGDLFRDLFAKAKPLADGGVVASPTYFPLSGGLGLAGEAGPEAILPLARGSDGRLGVAASGASPVNVSVSIATPDIAGFRQAEVQVAGTIARAVARGRRGL
jgi:phage-related minor tail protein